MSDETKTPGGSPTPSPPGVHPLDVASVSPSTVVGLDEATLLKMHNAAVFLDEPACGVVRQLIAALRESWAEVERLRAEREQARAAGDAARAEVESLEHRLHSLLWEVRDVFWRHSNR